MNFFVKLSQNKKAMVPIVVVVALTIFGSGFFIQNNRKVARQEAEQNQTETELKTDDLAAVDTIEEPETEPEADQPESDEVEKSEMDKPDEANLKPDKDKNDKKHEKPTQVSLRFSVEGDNVMVYIASNKAGKCYLKHYTDGAWHDYVETTSSNKKCVYTNVIEPGTTKLAAKFFSHNGTAAGYIERSL